MLQDDVAHASGPNDWGNWSAKARIEDVILVLCMMPACCRTMLLKLRGQMIGATGQPRPGRFNSSVV